jgi:hypothetical protein
MAIVLPKNTTTLPGTTYSKWDKGNPLNTNQANSLAGNQGKKRFTLGTTLDVLNKQKARAERGIAAHGSGGRWGRRLGKINNAITGMTPATTETVPGLPGLGQSFDDWYKGNQSGYNTRLDLANEAVNRKLAAQGLMGSGREVEMAKQTANEINAEAQADYRSEAQKNMDRAQSNADSMRNFFSNLLGTAASQSNMQYGSNAANAMSNNAMTQGQTGRRGGGGGSVSNPVKNDSTSFNLDLSSLLGKGQQGGNMWTSLLSSLFGGAATK